MRQRRRIAYSVAIIGIVTAAGLWVWPFRADGGGAGGGAVLLAPANPDAIRAYLQGAPRQPREAVGAAQLWIGREQAAKYTVADSNASKSGTARGEMTLKGGDRRGQWQYERLGQRIEFLTVAADGSVVLDRLENIERGVIVKLNPPVAVLPARLEPNRPVRHDVRMTVYDRGNPSQVKSSGKAVITVRYDADQTLSTPAGRFDCHRIRLTWDADFGFGTTASTTTCYYAEGVGLIAEDYDAQTTILLFTEERHITAVLAETPRLLGTSE